MAEPNMVIKSETLEQIKVQELQLRLAYAEGRIDGIEFALGRGPNRAESVSAKRGEWTYADKDGSPSESEQSEKEQLPLLTADMNQWAKVLDQIDSKKVYTGYLGCVYVDSGSFYVEVAKVLHKAMLSCDGCSVSRDDRWTYHPCVGHIMYFPDSVSASSRF